MSIDKNSTQVFINLFQCGLISIQEWNDFYQQTLNLQEDDEIADAIENWLQDKSRSQILQAYKERLKALLTSSSIDPDKTLGGFKTEPPNDPYQPSQTSRYLLDNAMPKPYPTTNPSSHLSSEFGGEEYAPRAGYANGGERLPCKNSVNK